MVGLDGVIVRFDNPATVSDVEPPTLPVVAAMVEVPMVTEFTMPALPVALLMLATEEFEEFQIVDCSVCVVPSLKVPTAVYC